MHSNIVRQQPDSELPLPPANAHRDVSPVLVPHSSSVTPCLDQALSGHASRVSGGPGGLSLRIRIRIQLRFGIRSTGPRHAKWSIATCGARRRARLSYDGTFTDLSWASVTFFNIEDAIDTGSPPCQCWYVVDDSRDAIGTAGRPACGPPSFCVPRSSSQTGADAMEHWKARSETRRNVHPRRQARTAQSSEERPAHADTGRCGHWSRR